MIKQIPCRLLDVREFFMGTGVGARYCLSSAVDDTLKSAQSHIVLGSC